MRRSVKELVEELNATDEHERIEAKSCTSGQPGKSVRKTVIAFSNEPGLGGGHIVFGVSRNSSGNYDIVGVEDPDRLQTEFNSQCNSDYNLQLRPTLRVEQVDGKNIVVARILEVSPGKKPVFLEATGLPKGAYRRIGSADQRCTEENIAEFYALRNADRRYSNAIEVREPLVRAVREVSSVIIDDLPTPFAPSSRADKQIASSQPSCFTISSPTKIWNGSATSTSSNPTMLRPSPSSTSERPAASTTPS